MDLKLGRGNRLRHGVLEVGTRPRGGCGGEHTHQSECVHPGIAIRATGKQKPSMSGGNVGCGILGVKRADFLVHPHGDTVGVSHPSQCSQIMVGSHLACLIAPSSCF